MIKENIDFENSTKDLDQYLELKPLFSIHYGKNITVIFHESSRIILDSFSN